MIDAEIVPDGVLLHGLMGNDAAYVLISIAYIEIHIRSGDGTAKNWYLHHPPTS